MLDASIVSAWERNEHTDKFAIVTTIKTAPGKLEE